MRVTLWDFAMCVVREEALARTYRRRFAEMHQFTPETSQRGSALHDFAESHAVCLRPIRLAKQVPQIERPIFARPFRMHLEPAFRDDPAQEQRAQRVLR